MRISTSQWYAQSLGSMLSQQKSLTETQLQLASGKRILRPSDDPVAATRALDVSRTLGKLEQYGRNASQVLASSAMFIVVVNTLVAAGVTAFVLWPVAPVLALPLQQVVGLQYHRGIAQQFFAQRLAPDALL